MFQKKFAPFVFAIAGLDPSGKAGLLLDVKVITSQGGYAGGVATALTVQGFHSGEGYQTVENEIVRKQIEQVWTEVPPRAVKIGMMPSLALARTVAQLIGRFKNIHKFPVIWDPVLISSDGLPLMDISNADEIFIYMAEVTDLITPNIPEFERLFGFVPAGVEEIRRAMLNSGVKGILLKGGHADTPTVTDIMVFGNKMAEHFRPRLQRKIRGTGCALSSALATHWAITENIWEAFKAAERFMDRFVSGQVRGLT